MSAGPLRIGRGLRLLFGIVGLVFMVMAFKETWVRSQGHVLPAWWHMAGAGALVLAGLAGAARGWVCLFGGQGSEKALTEAFYTAQLGKYVPGGMWQAVGQVGLSRRGGISLVQATTGFAVQALTLVAAGGTVGATLALVGFHLPVGVRAFALLGLALVLPLRRAWMTRLLGPLARLAGSKGIEALPSQGAILRSYGWGIWALAWIGAAFALLACSLQVTGSPAALVPAFALAWTIGFLAVPFPSGLGIREAVLISAVGSPAGAAPVIVASVVHRLITMLGELVMILVAKGHAAMSR
jgi:glycosyltransferase 2 family protein